MTEVGLQRPGIVALVGQGEATGVPQHVGMGLEAQLGGFASPLDHAREASGGEGRAALAGEDKRRGWILLPLEPTQRPKLVTDDGIRGGVPSSAVTASVFDHVPIRETAV